MVSGASGMKMVRLRQRGIILIVKNLENGQTGIPGAGDLQRLRIREWMTLILYYGLKINRDLPKGIIVKAEKIIYGCGGEERDF